MARINVEVRALTDPRFARLGRLLGTGRGDALLRMMFVWNECQERCAYVLPKDLVGDLLEREDGADLVVKSDLGEWIDEDSVRIKGTEGRVEWLEKKRAVARKNGALGGRPPAPIPPEEPTSVRPRFPQETPPAPAPAPTGDSGVPLRGTPPPEAGAPGSEKGEKKRQARKSATADDATVWAFVDLWNQHRGGMVRCSDVLSNKRASQIRARLREEPDLAYWERIIRWLARQAWMTGQNDSGWKADLEYLVRSEEQHRKFEERRNAEKQRSRGGAYSPAALPWSGRGASPLSPPVVDAGRGGPAGGVPPGDGRPGPGPQEPGNRPATPDLPPDQQHEARDPEVPGRGRDGRAGSGAPELDGPGEVGTFPDPPV